LLLDSGDNYLDTRRASLGWGICYIALTSVLTVPVAWLSYRFVEHWYFERGRDPAVTDFRLGQPS
jgi:peptidoglycan/LPS O-acetylase OafA/YrhL